jgi:vacuolar-type H+-ATPase subunit E/Vma4
MDTKLYAQVNADNAQELCRRIIQESESQSNSILAKAKAEAEKFLSEAKKRLEINSQIANQQLEKELAQIKQKIYSSLNLEKKRLTLEERNKFIDEVFEAVKSQAQGFRSLQDYPEFLKNEILEGADIISDGKISVLYSSLDEKIIDKNFIKEIEELTSQKAKRDILFEFQKSDFQDTGVVMRSHDGNILYDNTFISRLNRAHDEIYMKLLKEEF